MVVVVSCGNSEDIAKKIAKGIKGKYSKLKISSFPDGDVYMQYPSSVKGKKVIIVHSFQPRPNASLLKVVFAAETAKQLGAKKVVLVAPYLAYMRQDKRFHPGECISSRVMAKLLNNSIDKLITFDPHLHRYHSLKDIFKIPAKKLTANHLISNYIKKKIKNPVIIGPDWESYQWAEEIAHTIGSESTVLEKTRYSSRKVKVKMIKQADIKGKNAVIIDDIISTGHTIAEAAKKARNKGAKSVTAICVHGLFVENAIGKLKKAKVNRIVSSNSIKHPTNKIDLSSELIKELKKRI